MSSHSLNIELRILDTTARYLWSGTYLLSSSVVDARTPPEAGSLVTEVRRPTPPALLLRRGAAALLGRIDVVEERMACGAHRVRVGRRV